MGKHKMTPVQPDAPQLETFDTNEAKYDGMSPDAAVWGDSRSNQWGARFLRDAGFASPVNMGVSGITVENWLWELQNTQVDMSQAHTGIVEIGINSERYTDDTANEIAKGICQGVLQLAKHLADGAHIYVVQVYDCLPGTFDYSQAENDDVNAKLIEKADATGNFIFVPVSLDASDYADNIHLNDAGNAKVEAALVDAMQEHGDVPEPAWHPIDADPFAF